MSVTLRIPALASATGNGASLIFMHGLGDSGAGWSFIAEECRQKKVLDHVNFVFPDAPIQPVTMNFGMKMPSWFDIRSINGFYSEIDNEGIMQTIDTLNSIIDSEIARGIPSNRIVIGGFSQGCIASLAAGLSCEKKLAGILGLSGFLPPLERLHELRTEINKKTPVFLAHGTEDPVIDYKFSQMSAKRLESFNQPLEYHTYKGMNHTAIPEEINDIVTWLQKVLPA